MSFKITFDENDSALQQLEMHLEISQNNFLILSDLSFFCSLQHGGLPDDGC